MEATGTIQSKIKTIIPFLLFFSTSRITNGRYVDLAQQEKTTGVVYTIHITPFFAFGIINPFKK